MLTLIVDTQGRRQNFVFASDTVNVGRNEDNDLRIGSRVVSQHHCRIQRSAKGWKLQDLKSQNGTRVNGEEISQKILKAGDRIEVGQMPIFFMEAPEEVTEALNPDAEEFTPTLGEDVMISTRYEGGARGALAEEVARVFLEYRKTFGDERGLMEIENAVQDVSGRLFPRSAFSMPANAAKLLEITKAINSELNLKRCLALIIDQMIEWTDAERGFLILIDDRGRAKVKVARNFDNETVSKADIKFSRNIVEEVSRTKKAMISTSAQDDRRFASYQSVGALKLRSVICVPFRLRERVIGVLYLDHRFKNGAFSQRELDLVEAFADPAAVAIENARLYEANRETEEELQSRQKEVNELKSMLDSKLENQEIELAAFRSRTVEKADFNHDYSFIVGESPAMLEIFGLIDKIVETEVSVLIGGESGTGKELIAEAIHRYSKRCEKAFVKENCAAIPETLLESELFGYRKGAFTGADRDKIGLFQQAHGGTLFLDEIGEMSLDMQKKLLRVLQEGEIRPVGARETIKVDVRLLAASNRDLKNDIKSGSFREDLYYRINVINIKLPPLRERIEDIPLMVEHFLKSFALKQGAEVKQVDQIAINHLLAYHWPGNVRELQNEVQRACALGGAVINKDDFSKDIISHQELGESVGDLGDGPHWKEIVKMTAHQKEREIVLKALEESAWKKAGAARLLGISRPTLDAKIKSFGLAPYIQRGKKNLP